MTAFFIMHSNLSLFFDRTREGCYETAKIIVAIALLAFMLQRIIKNRHLDCEKYIVYWEQVKLEEEQQNGESFE